ncbi:BREX-3 system phosphatase PglZ, partial [Priestia megaterium]
MSDWRDEVFKKFQNQNSTLILIHDDDYLFDDELILSRLKEYGYEIIRFEDSVSFRYIYEQQYRTRDKNWKLIVYTNEKLVFPYEFLKKGFSVRVN